MVYFSLKQELDCCCFFSSKQIKAFLEDLQIMTLHLCATLISLVQRLCFGIKVHFLSGMVMHVLIWLIWLVVVCTNTNRTCGCCKLLQQEENTLTDWVSAALRLLSLLISFCF